MDTISSTGVGQVTAAPHATHGARAPSLFVDRNLRRIWNYRRVLRSPLCHPFRKLLRPLVRWVFASHLFVYDEARPDSPIGVNLKALSVSTVLLTLLLTPLVFVMLLPLVLILLPVAFCFGLVGIMATALQTDRDDHAHPSLISHALH